MKKNRKGTAAGLSRRLSFSEDEKRLSWLPLLLDAYAIADTGVAVAIRDEGKRTKAELACAKGCGNCCSHQTDLPFYPHELVGIYWYCSDKMTSPARDVLRNRLAGHTAGSGCPFLIDNSCSIHPLRPIGCRQFNVFTKPCADGEDPYFTRRGDVLVPIQDYIERAFAAVLPCYNMKREGDLAAAVKLVRSQIMNIQTYDWKKLFAAMEQADARRALSGQATR